MAWIIREPNNHFKVMVRTAWDNTIPIICATSDEGRLGGESYLDYLDECISIGAADQFGNTALWVSASKRTLFLPGIDIPIELDDGTKTVSGSSVATALACGFAGLLFFAKRFVAPEDPQGLDRFKGNLLQVFRRFTTLHDSRDHGYVNAALILRDILKREDSPEELKQRLETMVRYLEGHD